MLILEAAGNDPLQAQPMEQELTGAWWNRYLVWRKEYAAYLEAQERKARRKSGKVK